MALEADLMLNEQTVAAIVPARAGSKGLPRKNTLPLAGRPLIEWTIAAALGSSLIDKVIVSSDDSAALASARRLGVLPLPRPANLATDSTPTSDVLRHVHAEVRNFDILVLLQPTSPIRTSTHIDEALVLLAVCDTDAVVSVRESDVPPELMYHTDAVGRLQPVVDGGEVRRQDVRTTYVLNGAIYAAALRDLARVEYRYGQLSMTGYVMSREESVDIDNARDFELAHTILQARSDI